MVSHWQPAIARDLLDGLRAVLPARRRAAETEAFNILCPASFDRIALEQLELLFKLALEIPSSILYVGCHPSNCVEEVERLALEYAGKHSLGQDFVRTRMVFMGWLDLPRYMQSLKAVVHLVVNWGNYPGHTANQVCLAITAPVITVEGDSPPAIVPASMNHFAGVGALNVPNGPPEEVQKGVVRIARQLFDDEPLRCLISGHLESLVEEGRSLFCRRRTANDIELILRAIVCRKLDTAPGADPPMEFVSCQPELPLLSLDENGKLCHARRELGSGQALLEPARNAGEKRGRGQDEEQIFPNHSETPCGDLPDEVFGVPFPVQVRKRRCQGKEQIFLNTDGPSAITAENVSETHNMKLGLLQGDDLHDKALECSSSCCLCRPDQLTPCAFHLGEGGFPAPMLPEIARHPHSFRCVPNDELTEADLRAITIDRGVTVEKALEEHGIALHRASALRKNPELKLLEEAAHEQLLNIQDNDPKSFEGFKDAVFQDPPLRHDGGGIETGDGARTLTTPFGKRNCPKVVEYVTALVLETMGPGFEVVQGKTCGVFSQYDPPYSGLPNAQAQHHDVQCHLLSTGTGTGIIEENVAQCANAAISPRVFLCNASDGDVRLLVWIGSHILVLECLRFFARHYEAIHVSWVKRNPGSTEEEFHPYYSACVDQYIRSRFPEQQPILPKVLRLKPGDVVSLLGLTVHAGLSDGGMRLFTEARATTKHLQDNGRSGRPFFTPETAKSDPMETSWVTAGLLGLCPPPKRVVNTFWTQHVITQKLHAYLQYVLPARGFRKRRPDCSDSLWAAVNKQKAILGSDCMFTEDVLQIVGSVASSGGSAPTGVTGVVCKLGDGQQRSVIWLGEMPVGNDRMGRNSPVVRGAVIAAQLLQRLRRWKGVHPVGEASKSVLRNLMDPKCVLFTSFVGFQGVPMDIFFKKHFAEQCAQCLLTEPLRWLSLGLHETVEALHEKGFRLIVLFLNCFAYNPDTDVVQLIQAGFGALFDEARAKCNESSFKGGTGPTLMSRMQTGFYVRNGRAPASVDVGNLKTLHDASEPEGCDGQGRGDDTHADDQRAAAEVDSLLGRQPQDEVNLPLNSLLGWWRAKQRGKPCGMLVNTDNFLDPVMNPFQVGTDRPLDADALRASDMHQVSLELIRWFRPVPKDKPAAWKRDLQKILEKSVEIAEIEMVTFLESAGTKFRQPAAVKRLAQHLVMSLHRETRDRFIEETASSPFCATPIHTPEGEAQLSDEEGGIPLKIQLYPLDGDPQWKDKAMKSLTKAGFDMPGLARLSAHPRNACLKNEPDKGVGVFGKGEWDKGTFALWYVGRARQHGIRRYSVALQDGSWQYCDAEACRMLRLEWLIEKGLAGPFVNGELNPGACNLELVKDSWFEHEGLIWIPMRVKNTFKDAYCAWKYDHAADKGCSRLV